MADKRVTDALKKRDKEWADKQAKEKMTEDERRQAEEQERLQAQAKRDLDLTIKLPPSISLPICCKKLSTSLLSLGLASCIPFSIKKEPFT